MSPDDIAAVSELLESAQRVNGHRPLGEHKWLDLVQGGREGFAGVVAREPGAGAPVGYAQLSRGPGGWALEVVVDPGYPPARDLAADVVRKALEVVADEGGGHLHFWVPKPSPYHDAIAGAAGLSQGRDLLQLRRPLPAGPPPDLPVRRFQPGQDEHAWLEVNNRAFRHHPEQGSWDLATLKAREGQPWFDPSGFLLHERDGRLAAFCWTKVHRGQGLGEIYVVAVDPDFAGQGLGEAMVLAGLDWLYRAGLRTAMLYVDAGNTPARRLYEKLGFHVDHVDRAYVGDIPPAGLTPP